MRRCLWFVTQNRETRNKEKASRKNSLFIRRESGILMDSVCGDTTRWYRVAKMRRMHVAVCCSHTCCSVLQSCVLLRVAAICGAVYCSHVCSSTLLLFSFSVNGRAAAKGFSTDAATRHTKSAANQGARRRRAVACSCRAPSGYRVAKTHRMPRLCRSFFSQEPYN